MAGHLMETMQRVGAQEADHMGEAAAAEIAEQMKSGVSIDPPKEPEKIDLSGLPGVGDIVLYQTRRGEIRRGRNRVAALVVYHHPGTRLLDLAIFYEASDTMDQQRVPEAVGEERGWMLKPSPEVRGMSASVDSAQEIARLKHDVAELRQIVLGDYTAPITSILSMLDDVDKRVDNIIARSHAKESGIRTATEVRTKGKAKRRK